MDSFQKFSENKLSDRSKFFSSVKKKHVGEKKYFHVVDIWNEFKMNTMGDYHDLYLKTDVSVTSRCFWKVY